MKLFGRRLSVPAVVGLCGLLVFTIIALAAPWLSPHAPDQAYLLDRLSPPSLFGGNSGYLLGTDHLGRDMLSRLLYGSRVALIVGFSGVAIAAGLGIILGLLSGFFGGLVDSIIMRLVDTLISVPNVLLYLTVLGVFGPSFGILIAVIGLVNWTTFARVVRAEVLSVKRREYVEATRASGQKTWIVLARHILPNIGGPIIVVATLNLATIIILEASLSFLGLGVQPPTVTWGRMLADGRNYVATAWWLATFPGLFITALCLSLILLGDWLRDAMDPRLRGG